MRVFARHFFCGKDSVENFPAIVRNLEHLASSTGWDVEMIATFLPSFLPPKVDVRKVRLALTVSGKNEGAGSKVFEGFFERGKGIVLMVDGDMQTFSAEEIKVLKHLLTRMTAEHKAFGCYARTIVQMHRNPALNSLRIAQEAFYLSFCHPQMPDNPLNAALHIPSTYRLLGDVFSGCIAINLDHPTTQQIQKEVKKMRADGMFDGFALEYYLGMRFAQLEQTISSVLQTKQNHAVTDRSPEAVKEIVRKDYGELRQSLFGEALAAHIADLAVQQQVATLVGEEAMKEAIRLLR